MVKGSCLCGRVSFELDGELQAPRYCHCENCRKFSGTSPATWAMVNSSALQRDQTLPLGRFDSGRGIRCFCPQCGSPVWFESKDFPEIVGIPLGVIDEGEVPPPEMHLWVSSKPDWCVINDDLPKISESP